MSDLIGRPDYLPSAEADPLAQAVSAGIGGAPSFPHISIAQSRWRVVDASGNETVLKTFEIDFVVIAANPAKSKTYYARHYSPGETQPTAPDCFSDDGIRPDPSVTSPQSPNCATCPHNVWGSAINPVSGKKVKACKDSKRIAVAFISDGELSEIYGWRLSPMNMLAFNNFVQQEVTGRGIGLSHIVVRAGFDEKATFPQVTFKVLRNLTAAEFAKANELRAKPEAKIACGMQPTPVTIEVPARVVAAPAPAPAPTPAPAPAPAAPAAEQAKKSKLPEVSAVDDDLEAMLAAALK